MTNKVHTGAGTLYFDKKRKLVILGGGYTDYGVSMDELHKIFLKASKVLDVEVEGEKRISRVIRILGTFSVFTPRQKPDMTIIRSDTIFCVGCKDFTRPELEEFWDWAADILGYDVTYD